MKKYIKPVLESIGLTCEERMAGSGHSSNDNGGGWSYGWGHGWGRGWGRGRGRW